MTYPITQSDLASLRNELRTVRQKSSELEANLHAFRQEHNAHLRGIAAEREIREHAARTIRLAILIGILLILDVISCHLP
jgi:hypothetical protein